MSHLAKNVADWHSALPTYEAARLRGGQAFEHADQERLDREGDIADSAIDLVDSYSPGTLAETMAAHAHNFSREDAATLVSIFKALGDTDTATAVLNPTSPQGTA